MSSNITHNASPPPGGLLDTEQAPSVMAQDDPVAARLIGMFAAALVIFGAAALMMQRMGNRAGVGQGWATVWLTLGVIGLLFHAVYDSDIQFRRLYMTFGYIAIVVGVLLCSIGQFGTGCMLLLLAVGFLLSFLRNETDQNLCDICHLILGLVGGVFALIGLIGGSLRPQFFWPSSAAAGAAGAQDILWPYGLLLGVLGLVYLAACIGSRGTGDDRTYRLGQGMILLGSLVFLVALARSVFPETFGSADSPIPYVVRAGMMLICLGIGYVMVGMGLILDWPFVVLTRRELEGFFYTPVAYLVLFGFTLGHWVSYLLMMEQLSQGPMLEPVVGHLILEWPSIFFVIFAVPALTMRCLSEERRTGTLEVLMTTPIDERAVVLSKFLATFLVYMLMWLPMVVFLIALRIGGGNEFDYRPVLSFGIALAATGAGFTAMGVFCSNVSSNQIISAVLAFSGMLILTMAYWLKNQLVDRSEGSSNVLAEILRHASFLDFWLDAMKGKLILRSLLFPLSMTVFFLFLNIKILEARKWK